MNSIKDFQKTLEYSLENNDTHYISPDTNLEAIINKIDEKIKKNIEIYGFTFFEKEELAQKTRENVIKKLTRFDKIFWILTSYYQVAMGDWKL